MWYGSFTAEPEMGVYHSSLFWLTLNLVEYRQTNQTKEVIRRRPEGVFDFLPSRCLSKFRFDSLFSRGNASVASSASTASLSSRSGFVDGDSPSLHVSSIQVCHRFLRFLICGHLDESESSRCSSEPVGDYLTGRDLAKGLEGLPKFCLCDIT